MENGGDCYMTHLDKLYAIEKDLSVIGLTLTRDFPPCFCTPLNAITFAYLGTDGIHFCIPKSEKGIENSPVYIVSPTMPGHYIELIGRNLIDFLSLVISCKDASALEYISYASEDKFIEHIRKINIEITENPEFNMAVEDVIFTLRTVFEIQNITDIYNHVKSTKDNSIYNVNLDFHKKYRELIEKE